MKHFALLACVILLGYAALIAMRYSDHLPEKAQPAF
jgi:hypothetical protein